MRVRGFVKLIIEFDLAGQNNIDIIVSDISGRILIHENLGICTPGKYFHEVTIDRKIQSGVLPVTLKIGNDINTKNIIIYD